MASEGQLSDPRAMSRFAIILPVAAALVGAIVGAGGGILGAYISTNQQSENARTENLLAQREIGYLDFLDTSNAYANASHALTEFEDQGHTLIETQANFDLINDFRNTRFDLRGAYNSIGIFGSIGAFEAARDIMLVLPDTRGQEVEFGYDPDVFTDTTIAFQDNFCFEVQPDRKDCIPE